MSVTKTKATKHYKTDQDVKFKLSQLNVSSIQNKQNIAMSAILIGTVDDTDGEVDRVGATLNLADVLAEFTASEKGAAKEFLKAVERTVAKKVSELSGLPHDEEDVFE